MNLSIIFSTLYSEGKKQLLKRWLHNISGYFCASYKKSKLEVKGKKLKDILKIYIGIKDFSQSMYPEKEFQLQFIVEEIYIK